MPFYDFWREKQVTALGRRWSRQAAEYTLRVISRHVDPLTRVVEIGPGRGMLAAACRARRLHYIGIDANNGLLTALDPGSAICAFAPPLPLQNAMCDAVVANHVLEHAADLPQAQALVTEMRRIVRPGGVVTITSPDALWEGIEFWDCDYSHNFVTTARRLHQMFHDQNLKIVYLSYVHNHLEGLAGMLAGQIARLAPYRIPGAPPTSPFYVDQIYKLRMTFARSVLIVGRRI
ncbi:class I SAM-dependent methyltransferase [Roseiflexus sp.]|uniref:class I SAM-dependent methyltransferase n=1 Tax=Roseiflexus sp. TaxID=2562120 RepID=UPI00398A85FB